MKYLLILLLFISVDLFAADLTWSFTTPAGVVTYTSIELDAISPGETLTHYDRVIRWACEAHPLDDEDGDPIGCATNATKAQHIRARQKASWLGWRSNVLRWEAVQRRALADDEEAVIPEE